MIAEIPYTNGKLWMSDARSFADARLGLGHLYQFNVPSIDYPVGAGLAPSWLVAQSHLIFNTGPVVGKTITQASLVFSPINIFSLYDNDGLLVFKTSGIDSYIPPSGLTNLIGTGPSGSPNPPPASVSIQIANPGFLSQSNTVVLTLSTKYTIDGIPPPNVSHFGSNSSPTTNVKLVVTYDEQAPPPPPPPGPGEPPFPPPPTNAAIVMNPASGKFMKMAALQNGSTETFYGSYFAGLFAALGTEFSGGGYSRAGPVTFTNGASSSVMNFGPATADWPPANFVGLIEQSTGIIVCYARVGTPLAARRGDVLRIPVGGLAFTIPVQPQAPALTNALANFLLYRTGTVLDMFPDAAVQNRVFEVGLYGSAGNEFSGGGYQRRTTLMADAGNGIIRNVSDLVFGPIVGTWPTIGGVGLLISNQIRFFASLSQTIPSGTRNVFIPAGYLRFRAGHSQ